MKVLGKISINGEKKELVIQKEGNLYKYFLGDMVIGAFDPDVMGDSLIVFRENTIENELSGQIRDEITQIVEKAGRDEIMKNDEKIQEDGNVYDRQMGYQRTIGTNEMRDKKSEDKEEDINYNKDKQQEGLFRGKNGNIENTTADIKIKQDVDMNTMVTDFDTLGERLEKAGKIKDGDEKNGKLGIVESDELDNLRDENGKKLEGHSSRYETVVITNKTGKDGKPIVRALELEDDVQEGTNPTERNYQVKQNKNESIKKGDVLTRVKIKDEETIGIDNREYGEIEVYHSYNKTLGGKGIEGNKSLDRQLETSESKNPLEGTDEKTQKLAQEYQDGYRSVESSYQEAKRHENAKGEPCKELRQEEIDGDLNTKTHNHVDETVVELMKNEEIRDKFTEREVREMVEKAFEKKENDEPLETLKKRVEEDIKEDAENMRGERGR